MAAVQSHGFVYEDRICKIKTGLSKEELGGKYTAIHDIPKGYYGDRYIENNISCKTTKSNSVGCGDISRFYQSLDEPLDFVIGVYKQTSKTTKTFHTTYVFKFSEENRNILFGGIPYDVIQSFDSYVKSIPNGKEGQEANKKEWKARRKHIYDQYGKGSISIDAKIDSKNQRRVQCSLKLKDLIASIPYEKYTDEYMGMDITFDFESSTRTFK